MLRRQLKRVTAKRERTRTVAEPLDVEPGNLLLEPAGTEDDVLRPDIDIVEIQRVPVFAREETRRLAERKSFGAKLDENRTDTVHTWAEADVDEEHGRMETVRGEHLLAADAPAVATRSEEHTSELQSLMRHSYAVF